MKITLQNKSESVVELLLQGRLDTAGARQLQADLDDQVAPGVIAMVWNMREVGYLSSAGLRVMLGMQKELARRGGGIVLAELQPYCREVVATAGFENIAPQFESLDDALEHARRLADSSAARRDWDVLETAQTDLCDYRFVHVGDKPGVANILGDVRDVLHAAATPERLAAKRFFATEYSLGLGGLGDKPSDYFKIMGEMMTVGGTMVWLPTDGQNTPDFLIPKHDSHHVMIHTTFNVALAGGFNECALCLSRKPEGVSISDLYRDLFDLARRRRKNFKGIIGLAARLQMDKVLGSCVKKSPVSDYAPADGKMISHAGHIAEWLDCDTEPRHRDVTALMVGVGADLTADLSDYDETMLNRVFYLHPANIGGKTALLHNHAVVFAGQPMPEKPVDIDQEVRAVINAGDFLDMRHLLDTSTFTAGLVGISYIQELRAEKPEVLADNGVADEPPPDIRRKMDSYRRLQS